MEKVLTQAEGRSCQVAASDRGVKFRDRANRIQKQLEPEEPARMKQEKM
jgi:hypothetical protein